VGVWAGRWLSVAGLVTSLVCLSTIGALAGAPGGPGGGGPGGGGHGDPGVTITVGNLIAVEGTPFAADIHFTDPDPTATAAQYTANISWGDGGTQPGTIVRVTTGTTGPVQFAVEASHIYASVSTNTICADVTDPDLRSTSRACGTAEVREAPVTLHGISDARVNPYCDSVATIEDSNYKGWIGEYTTTIDWGDGSTSSGGLAQGVYVPGVSVTFTVQGCHTYAALGPHSVTTTVFDFGTLVGAVSSTAWVYALSDGGTFVIGDGNAAIGSQVMFWGGQWAKANSLSGGDAPPAFKGFAPSSSASCGGTWSASPGAASNPPAAVPAYTAVLVSSSIDKHGSSVDGNSIHVALVRTDPGYGSTPDEPGTGTVVLMIC